jgi:tRNA1Val (adenine37-N6)-methyltransferase
MKVGTDGCLLGAWADCMLRPQHVLDIGAGTGLMSLMLAQRFPQVKIEAVEIGEECATQCRENISNSPWTDRIATHNVAIQNFEHSAIFDLIVCNPPFFSNSFASPNQARHTARHDDSLSVDQLFASVKRLLSANGVFSLIIPTDRISDFATASQKHSLFIKRKTWVKATPTKAAKRVLLSFGYLKAESEENEMFIETSRGNYSEDFRNLLADFYLYL